MNVHHLALGVHDLERQTDFYSRVVGLKIVQWHHDDSGGRRSAWLALGDEAFLALEKVGRPPPHPGDSWHDDAPGYFLLALQIGASERESFKSRLREHGVPIHHESAWTLYFRDPEGNRVALSHHPNAQIGL
jgi:catechol 2,3-dioxygenase-like lactoylglutathione lyase family enzyme